MTSRFALIAGAASLVLAASPSAKASYIIGEWSNPVLAGNALTYTGVGYTSPSNLGGYFLTPLDYTSNAVYSITGSAGNTLSYGTCAYPNATPKNYGYPCQTTITFNGTSSIPTNPIQPFQIGTITYTNGADGNFIFGATLSFYKVTNTTQQLIGSDFVDLVTTLPPTGGPYSASESVALNADYFTFSGLANTSGNIPEGATIDFGLNGFVVGDPVLTLTGLTALSSGGFVSNSPAIPTGVPEPATIALLGTGLVGLFSVRRVRGRRRR